MINIQRVSDLLTLKAKGNLDTQEQDELDSLLIDIQERLQELREEIVKECISYDEIAELQSLVEYIDPSDVQLLEWAGVPEFGCEQCGSTDDRMVLITNDQIYGKCVRKNHTRALGR